MTDLPEIDIADRAALRAWLVAHHAEPGAIWLIRWKKPHPGWFSYDDLVEELLCWGWIDSQPRAIDAARSANMIAPRNPRSAWSAVNKRRVEEARAKGLMQPPGEAAVARAVANGQWAALDQVETLDLPPDLAQSLTPQARAVFDAWPKWLRRACLEWITTAKTAPTRAKRIAEVAESAARDERPKPFAGKPKEG
jgi:uncharacterized protein YdeI (YjbR/CyaY-like superfamily)